MEDIKGKVAYVTGGTKGIGLGIAQKLLENGMRVAISGRSLDDAQEVAKSLGTESEIIGLQSDVRNFEDEQQAIQSTVKQFGQVDLVVANAGLGYFASVVDLTIDQWNTMIDTNLTGVFHTTKASIEVLKKSQGYLMTIASLAGTNFFATASGYNASKFGVVGFTQAAMLDLRDYGIKVTTIMPGSVATHFNNHVPSEADAWKIQPEDIGQIVVDLMQMDKRTLPSKIEVRPSFPAK